LEPIKYSITLYTPEEKSDLTNPYGNSTISLQVAQSPISMKKKKKKPKKSI